MSSAAVGKWSSREDFKKAKELDEARKAGTALPEVDEDGKDINPHIPQYILKTPWYFGSDKPTLKHQKVQSAPVDDTGLLNREWYARGQKAGPAATKYRKGACTNCGSMTHNAKACVERPRKLGAKHTGKDIKEDETVQKISLDYDGKRDRWNGYDPDQYKRVIATHELAEQERRKKKAEEMLTKALTSKTDQKSEQNGEVIEIKEKEKNLGLDVESDDETDDADYVEKEGFNNAPVQKIDSKTRTTIRNLRIREDTAKYLRNLDLDSAYYDPKTRSMRENPNPVGKPNEITYFGDNYIRAQGDAQKFKEIEHFAWDAYETGQDVHLQGLPSQAELMYQEYKRKREALKEKTKAAILGKYGGEEHLNVPPPELLLAQTENYLEYSKDGRLIKGPGVGISEKVVAKSKYEEDVYINNHTKIWGSYWENGEWGFACCRQTIKSSYCTGQKGIELKESMLRGNQTEENNEHNENNVENEASLLEQNTKANKKKWEKEKKMKMEKEAKEKEEKLKAALEKEEAAKKNVEKNERKRGYNSLGKAEDYTVTEEQVEAYQMKRAREEDPMANFVDEE